MFPEESVKHPVSRAEADGHTKRHLSHCLEQLYKGWGGNGEKKAEETEALHNTVIAIHNTHWRIKRAIRGPNLGAIKSF